MEKLKKTNEKLSNFERPLNATYVCGRPTFIYQPKQKKKEKVNENRKGVLIKILHVGSVAKYLCFCLFYRLIEVVVLPCHSYERGFL